MRRLGAPGVRAGEGGAVRLGLRENVAQFSLLVALNALVGAMVGLERSVLPLLGKEDFGLTSETAILSFVIAFGVAKAIANLLAGRLADRAGRRRLLVAGWIFALPVPALIGLAPSWSYVVAANVFLGASQGFAWSMTVVMKVDLVGPKRRGLALGFNETAGYLGVAATAFATGAFASSVAPRTLIWAIGVAIAGVGLLASLVLIRDTAAHVALEQRGAGSALGAPMHQSVLRACAQAGLVNNLNDALAWGLAPLFLAAHGASAARIGAVAGLYPAVWGIGQIGGGWISDRIGRKPPIVAGMFLQAAALGLLAASGGNFAAALAAAALLGLGTALAYPTLIAAVSDAVSPLERARAVGVYRFWRDTGFVVGGVLAGVVAQSVGATTAIAVVAVLTALSGAWVVVTHWTTSIAAADTRYRELRLDRMGPTPYRR